MNDTHSTNPRHTMGPDAESAVGPADQLSVDWEVYRPFALRLARRHQPHGILDREDMEAIALTALWRAAHRYDPRRDTTFLTFAHAAIMGELKHARRDTSGVAAWAYESGVRFLTTSLDTWAGGDDDESKRSWLAAEDEDLTGTPDRIDLAALLAQLPARTRRIVWAVAGEGYTRSDLAREFGISIDYACRLYRAGLARLAFLASRQKLGH